MALDIKQKLYGIPGAGIESYFVKFTNAGNQETKILRKERHEQERRKLI